MGDFRMPCRRDECTFSGTMTERAKQAGGIHITVDEFTSLRWTSDGSGGPHQHTNTYAGWKLCLEYPAPAGLFYDWTLSELYPCPAAYYCPGSSQPLQCEGEEYLENWTATGSSECTLAPAGSFYNHETSTAEVCPAGFYCPGGTQPQQCAGEMVLLLDSSPGQTTCSSCPLPRVSASDGLSCEHQVAAIILFICTLVLLVAAAVFTNSRFNYVPPRHLFKTKFGMGCAVHWCCYTVLVITMNVVYATVVETVLILVGLLGTLILSGVHFALLFPREPDRVSCSFHTPARLYLSTLLHVSAPLSCMWLDSLIRVSMELNGGGPYWRGYFWIAVGSVPVVLLTWLAAAYPLAAAHVESYQLMQCVLQLQEASLDLSSLNLHRVRPHTSSTQLLEDARPLVHQLAKLHERLQRSVASAAEGQVAANLVEFAKRSSSSDLPRPLSNVGAVLTKAAVSVKQAKFVVLPLIERTIVEQLASAVAGQVESEIVIELVSDVHPRTQIVVFPDSTIEQVKAVACSAWKGFPRTTEVRMEFAGRTLSDDDVVGREGLCTGALVVCYQQPLDQQDIEVGKQMQDQLWERWRDPDLLQPWTDIAGADEEHSGMGVQQLKEKQKDVVEIALLEQRPARSRSESGDDFSDSD